MTVTTTTATAQATKTTPAKKTDAKLEYVFGGCDTGELNGGASHVTFFVKPDEAKPS